MFGGILSINKTIFTKGDEELHYLNYEEHRRHGTEEFPLDFYSVDEKHSRYYMHYHWHKETELLYVLSGEFVLSLNGTEHRLREGELCYIPGGALHGGDPTNCVYECIDFDIGTLLQQTRLVRHYLREMENEQTAVQTLFTKEQPGILKCASRLFAAARTQNAGWELLVLAGLFDFYGTVFQKHYFSETASKKMQQEKVQQVKAAIEYIELNYQHFISLDDLARIAGLSAKYFCRYFRLITNRTPIDYLNYYRTERACYLLQQQKKSVTEIAYECGFNDISYFIRCFKRYQNTTPHQYAKSIKQIEHN